MPAHKSNRKEASPETQTGINVIVNLIPAILVGISVAIMKFYKLNEKTMDGIMAELKARRAGQAGTETAEA